MKSSRSHLAPRLTYSALAVAISLVFAAAAAKGAQKNVTVPLAGKAFGQQVTQSGPKSVDLHAASAASLVNASAGNYYYHILGTCHGTGDFANIVAPGTELSALVNEFQPGAAKSLVGVRHDADGQLPFPVLNKTVSGTSNGVSFSIKLSINISATGLVSFDVDNVSVNSPFGPPSGTIEFEQGSKVLVGVAPVIKMGAANLSVVEAKQEFPMTVKRTGNLNSSCSVRYGTHPDTADKDDFGPKSGTVFFAPGEDTKTIHVGIKNNDAQPEGSEQFFVSIFAPIGATLGDPAKTVITITEQ